jgi:hypothetical protein
MKKFLFCTIGLLFVISFLNSCKKDNNSGSTSIIIDHNCTKLSQIPQNAISNARTNLRIAYGRSWNSGAQLISGMNGLVTFKGSLYDFNNQGSAGALYFEIFRGGANDLGNPNDTAWEVLTRNYLTDTSTNNINVVMWSWGDEVSNLTSIDINKYLTLMSNLEKDFPQVKFVYMTGHLDGTGLTDNLYMRNEQIREFCMNNGKILYDLADIESYNPDGVYFGDKLANENCDYDSNNDGILDKNWAIDWQNAHTENVDWYNCNPPGTQSLNANQQAYAAWWLWARLAGWNGK